MKAVLQRVLKAEIKIDGCQGGSIGPGLVVLLGIMRGDTKAHADILAKKIMELRIFTDACDKINLSVSDIKGSLMVVSNFTLGADCKKGRRPSFDQSAPPYEAEPLYDYFVAQVKSFGRPVETGRFGADMEVSLINDGPVTVILDTNIWDKDRNEVV